jgi:hypothetical protein
MALTAVGTTGFTRPETDRQQLRLSVAHVGTPLHPACPNLAVVRGRLQGARSRAAIAKSPQPKEQAHELSSEKTGKNFCEVSNQQMSIT